MVELCVAAGIWGFAFIAIHMALEEVGPFWINAIRFVGAVAVGAPLVLLVPPSRRPKRGSAASLSVLPGLALAGALLLQSWGMRYTTVTKSAFLTCLYVLFVPVLGALAPGGKRSTPTQMGCAALAMAGAAMMTGFVPGGWNRGDLLMVGCAVLAAIQILLLDRVSNRVPSPFAFNLFQSAWAALPALAIALAFEPLPSWPISGKVWACIATLALASTLFAFFIQIRAQRQLPTDVVSMIFLLESPFAALFALLLLGEVPTPLQIGGALTILGAAALTVRLQAMPRGS